MEIILLEDVKKVGKKNTIVKVKDGYGNNFLIKKNLAVLATKEAKDKLTNQLDNMEKEQEQAVSNFFDMKSKIEKENLEFNLKEKDGKVFGSITTKQIIVSLSDKYDIKQNQINSDHKLNELGEHIVKIELHKKVTAKLKITIKKG